MPDVDPERFSDNTFAAYSVTPSPRLDCAVAGRRAGWLSGRLAAQAARAEIGRPSATPGADAEGVPLWPKGISVSISHTDGHAAAIGGLGTHRLGVDVEHVPEGQRLAGMRAAVLTEAERACLSVPSQATAGFSAKECPYKALYPKLRAFFGCDAAEVTGFGDGTLELTLARDLSDDRRAGHAFRTCRRSTETTILTWLSALR